jgi:hypothetical protein
MARGIDSEGFNDENIHLVIDLGNKVQRRIREVLDDESHINVFDVSNNGSENSGGNSDEESDPQTSTIAGGKVTCSVWI